MPELIETCPNQDVINDKKLTENVDLKVIRPKFFYFKYVNFMSFMTS